MSTSIPVLTRDAVRELDRRAIEEAGMPSFALMESAGRACADVAQELVEDAGAVVCLCGPGNNGGDGLVVARTLHNRGVAAEVVLVGGLSRFERGSADLTSNLRLWRGLGRTTRALCEAGDVPGLLSEWRGALFVDALFGTGSTRALGEPYLELVEGLNAAAARVLAVDVPSGLDADTGEELGRALRAQCTVTFVAAKPGLLRGLGPAVTGELRVAEIGIPRPYLDEALAGGSSAG